MAEPTKEQLQAIQEMTAAYTELNEKLGGIGAQIKQITQDTEDMDDATRKAASAYATEFNNAVKNVVKSNQEIAFLQEKQLKGEKLNSGEQKKLARFQERIAKDRKVAEEALNKLRTQGVNITAEQEFNLEGMADSAAEMGSNAQQTNVDLISQRGIFGNLVDNAKEYVKEWDKTGLAAAFLNDELSTTQKLSHAAEVAIGLLVKGAYAGSENIANLEKNLGISYKSAYNLQNSMAVTAAKSDKLFVTSERLNKSFTDLAAQTGIISDFGGDTLVTMTTLTKQLGLGVKEASQLALLARTQGEDTEGILENTVDTVNAVNKQRNASISAKDVLNDIATASADIVVSLGMSPEILAEAATEARALGTSLSTVDSIAESLLNFESSIENELKFQMLTGKEINLEKARQLALDNDLAGLSKEIADNSEITEAFATGNRIQQQAAADALGMSRQQLGEMVMQQEYLNLSQDEFVSKYGEQSYQQMQAMSASEKFAESMNKIKGVINDIGTIFSPILDGFAWLVGTLAKSKTLLVTISAVLGGLVAYKAALAIQAMITAISSIWEYAAIGGLGWGTVALGAAGTAGLIGAVAAGVGAIQAVEDGYAPSERGPFTITDAYGAMATTATGDSLSVSPNLGRGDNQLLAAVNKLVAKDTNVYMDSQNVGSVMATATSKF